MTIFARNMTRTDPRQVIPKSLKINVNLVTVYNSIIKNLQTITRKSLPMLYSHPGKKKALQKVPLI